MADVQYVWGKNPTYIPARKPIWQTLMPYFSQAANQNRSRRFQERMVQEKRVYDQQQRQKEIDRQRALRPKTFSIPLTGADGKPIRDASGKPRVVNMVEVGGKWSVISDPKATNNKDRFSEIRIATEGDESKLRPGTRYVMNLTTNKPQVIQQPKSDGKQSPLRNLDIYAQSIGINPQRLRGQGDPLTQQEADMLTNKIIEVGDRSFLSQLLRGAFSGAKAAKLQTQESKKREAELIRKEVDGTITPDELKELEKIESSR